jgi:filamentous hemagglutinin
VLPKDIEGIKVDMLAGLFHYERADARLRGWLSDKGAYYIGEGHHRVNAALEIFWETGDRTCLERLLEHGHWREGAPEDSTRLLTRRVWSRILSWLGL